MSYNYSQERPKVFTEEGQRTFLKIRDNMAKHCRESGAVSYMKAAKDAHASDSWMELACVDRLIELGEYKCIYDEARAQDRIFMAC